MPTDYRHVVDLVPCDTCGAPISEACRERMHGLSSGTLKGRPSFLILTACRLERCRATHWQRVRPMPHGPRLSRYGHLSQQ